MHAAVRAEVGLAVGGMGVGVAVEVAVAAGAGVSDGNGVSVAVGLAGLETAGMLPSDAAGGVDTQAAKNNPITRVADKME